MSYQSRPNRNYFSWFILASAIILSSAFIAGVWYGQIKPERPDWLKSPTVTPTATRPAPYDLAEAKAFYAEGKLDEAVAAYEQVILKDPTDIASLIEQSRLLIFTGDTSKSLLRAEEAVRLDPQNSHNLTHYCRALDWEAKYEEAFEACFCAIELDENNATAYAFVSEIYTDIGYTTNAQEYAEDAIRLEPDNFYAHFNLGYALEVEGDYEEAARAYDQSIKFAPNIPTGYIAAGLMYHTMGQYRKYRKLEPYNVAIDRFKRAIRLRPFNAEAYTRLGRTYYFDAQYGRALDALEQGLGVDPTYGRGWGYLGDVYYTRRRFEDAVQIFPKAIEQSEQKILGQARLLQLYTTAPTASGPASVPIMEARLVKTENPQEQRYIAEFRVLAYEPSTELDIDQSCALNIAQSLKARTIIVEPEQPITFTQAFSQTTGQATFDLTSGELAIDLNNLPLSKEPYELKMEFWPNKTETIVFFEPRPDGTAPFNYTITKNENAPVQYYYQLGLSYAYLDQCDDSESWLLKSLEIEPAPWNPAWQGLKRCPSPHSPPTPIPTATPIPSPTPG